MPVLVTCKFYGDWIQSNWKKMDTPFFHCKSMGEKIQHSRANNSKVNNPIWPKFNFFWVFTLVLVACMFDKYLVKGDWEKLETSFFFTTEGHATPKWLVRCGWNSNPSNISCLSLLPVSLMRIELRKSGDIIFSSISPWENIFTLKGE